MRTVPVVYVTALDKAIAGEVKAGSAVIVVIVVVIAVAVLRMISVMIVGPVTPSLPGMSVVDFAPVLMPPVSIIVMMPGGSMVVPVPIAIGVPVSMPMTVFVPVPSRAVFTPVIVIVRPFVAGFMARWARLSRWLPGRRGSRECQQ
jgi:hypothetical protein